MSSQEKPVVTREIAFAALDRLKALGIEPTNRKLLNEVGGSMTTIAGFLREWRAQQSAAVAPAAEVVEVPATVAEAGSAAVAAIWSACHVEARREIATINEQAEHRVQLAEKDRDNALGELEGAVNELKAAHANAAELTAALEALRADYAATQTEAVGREAASAATIEQMTRQIDAHASELVRVHADLNESRQAHATELSRLISDFTRQTAELHESLARERDMSEKLKLELGQARTQQTEEHERSRQAISEVQQVRHELELTRLSSDHHKSENSKLAVVVERLQDDLKVLRKQQEAAMRSHGVTLGECEVLRTQVQEQQLMINSLIPREAPRPGGPDSSKSTTLQKSRPK